MIYQPQLVSYNFILTYGLKKCLMHTIASSNNLIFISLGTFGATLAYMVKDCDPATGLPDSDEGYDDTYMVR